MKDITRRKFLSQGSAGLAAALTLSAIPDFINATKIFPENNIPIGFQTFPIRDLLMKDFSGTLRQMAAMGYKIVEMCSPSGYTTAGFAAMENTKAIDIKRMINEAGLTCPSCHFSFGELEKNLENRIEFAHQLGLSHMVCSSFWLQGNIRLKDYQDAADKLNKIAEKISKAGLQTGFHNHEMEFKVLEGTLIYDAIMKALDPALVKMQFQTEVIQEGYKAATYFNKYPGRFISSHLSDWTTDKKQAPIGKGMIDWKEYFAAAKTGGVKYFFVEMEMDTFKESAAYIHQLNM